MRRLQGKSWRPWTAVLRFIRALADTAEKEGLTLTCAVDRKQFHVVKEIIDRHDPRGLCDRVTDERNLWRGVYQGITGNWEEKVEIQRSQKCYLAFLASYLLPVAKPAKIRS